MTRLLLSGIGMVVLMKLFPWYYRWKIRRSIEKPDSDPPKGKISKIEIYGVKGDIPELPQKLTERQREILSALVAQDRLWSFHTNLWELFGLPTSRLGLENWINTRGKH